MIEEKVQATSKYWTVMFIFIGISTNFFSPRQNSINIVLSFPSNKTKLGKSF